MKATLIKLCSVGILFSCTQTATKDSSISTYRFDKDIKEETYIASPIGMQHEFSLSLFSMIQAIEDHLFITPFGTADNYVLFSYNTGNNSYCCPDFKGHIRYGRGPKENETISMGTKTPTQDTVLFYSVNSNRYTIIDKSGEPTEEITIKAKPNLGYSFAYSNNKLLTSVFNPMFNSEVLFQIQDIKTEKGIEFFEARVPNGYDPEIRNVPTALASVEDGFAIAFVGDKEIHFYDFEGEPIKKYVFGENEPIRIRKKSSGNDEGSSSMPYVYKIEFCNGFLFALIQNQLWIVDYTEDRVVTKLKILEDPDQETAPLNDFSIGGDKIYLRFRRDDLAYLPVDEQWFGD